MNVAIDVSSLPERKHTTPTTSSNLRQRVLVVEGVGVEALLASGALEVIRVEGTRAAHLPHVSGAVTASRDKHHSTTYQHISSHVLSTRDADAARGRLQVVLVHCGHLSA